MDFPIFGVVCNVSTLNGDTRLSVCVCVSYFLYYHSIVLHISPFVSALIHTDCDCLSKPRKRKKKKKKKKNMSAARTWAEPEHLNMYGWHVGLYAAMILSGAYAKWMHGAACPLAEEISSWVHCFNETMIEDKDRHRANTQAICKILLIWSVWQATNTVSLMNMPMEFLHKFSTAQTRCFKHTACAFL